MDDYSLFIKYHSSILKFTDGNHSIRNALKGEVGLFQDKCFFVDKKTFLFKIMDLAAQEEFTDNFWCF